MSHGRTVRIFLPDGNASGIRHAELVNWTGQAMVVPRHRVAELKDWAEAQCPGVYFLFGDIGEDGRREAYIGEAENVRDRLRNHLGNKDFWTTATFITSKDDNLTKSHVKYLEARLLEIAHAAGRVALLNGNAPKRPTLPRADVAAMEEFLEPLQLLLTSLGFPALETARRPTHGSENPLAKVEFTLAVRGEPARGALVDEGFLVLAGSAASSETRESLSGGYAKQRATLIADGVLTPAGDEMTLSRDHLFSSPSAAAAVLVGYPFNGREGWKAPDGRSLKQLEEEEAKTNA